MLTTCLAVCVVALQAGNVVVIPRETPLVAAGHYNWVLREGSFAVPPGTRAIVLRTSPADLEGVVEVRVFDGTNRLAWLVAAGLTALTSGNASRGEASPADPASLSRVASRSAGGQEPSPRKRRKYRPDFRAVDAAITSMMLAALSAPPPSSRMVTSAMPVFNMEVFTMPVFHMEVFSMPVFTMPVFNMEVF